MIVMICESQIVIETILELEISMESSIVFEVFQKKKSSWMRLSSHEHNANRLRISTSWLEWKIKPIRFGQINRLKPPAKAANGINGAASTVEVPLSYWAFHSLILLTLLTSGWLIGRLNSISRRPPCGYSN